MSPPRKTRCARLSPYLERRSLLVDAAAILAFILVGVVGYRLSPLLLPKADITVAPLPGCDLHQGACGADLPAGGRLTFALAPRPVPVTRPIEVEVHLAGVKADKVEVDFAGVDMAMGFNRPVLAAAGEGRFVAQTVLPVCVTGRMAWRATVVVESGARRIAVPFRFMAGEVA
mgnify:CR=1 FL=1